VKVTTKYYDDEVTREIQSRLDIVDVISETVELKRKGNRYWGVCPFHQEKTPSFSVSQDKQMFYCFGCHAGGDIFSYVMKKESFDFKETVNYLAQKAGIQVRTADRRETDRRRQVIEVNKAAVQFYRQVLGEPRGREARSYINQRGIENDIVQTFALGYAPDSWNALGDYLKRKGFSHEDIVLAGVVKHNEDKNSYYDLLRNRLIFPIYNQYGEVIGFGGRVMDDSLPKYLNSPETHIFSKRKNLYGLYFAKDHIRADNEAILVEGYMDCLKLHQAGVQNAVSSLGTAFTAEQARLLHRYTEKVVVLFDGDEAGQRETLRAIDILNQEKLKIDIITLPDGKDPDEYLTLFGKEEFWHYIKNNRTSKIEFKINRYIDSVSGLDLDAKSGIIKSLQEDIINLESEIEKDYYVKILARKLAVEENLIYRQFGMTAGVSPGYSRNRNKTAIIRDNNKYGKYGIQEKIITAMVSDTKAFDLVKNSIGFNFFKNEDYCTIANLYDELTGDSEARLKLLKNMVPAIGLEATLARILFFLDEGISANKVEINDFINRVKQLRTQARWNKVTKNLEQLADNGNFNSFLTFILKLDEFLNHHPGRGDKISENR
jgi:DNA primase